MLEGIRRRARCSRQNHGMSIKAILTWRPRWRWRDDGRQLSTRSHGDRLQRRPSATKRRIAGPIIFIDVRDDDTNCRHYYAASTRRRQPPAKSPALLHQAAQRPGAGAFRRLVKMGIIVLHDSGQRLIFTRCRQHRLFGYGILTINDIFTRNIL